jgi:predicted Zn-dependent protease
MIKPPAALATSQAASPPQAAAPVVQQELPPQAAQVPPSPPPAAISEPVVQQEPLPQAVPTPSVTAEPAPNTCDTVRTCADAMLSAAKKEALLSAMESAQRIDAMQKPERGDRKLARKLNTEGLEVLKQRNLADAVALFTKAHDADRADEEIISNLIYAYGEDGNFTKAEQLAYDGLLLNPRRANIWLPIAIAKQKQNKSDEALQAMWLAWQFSGDKQRMLDLLDKRIAEETDASLNSLYVNAKAWAVDGKKPGF